MRYIHDFFLLIGTCPYSKTNNEHKSSTIQEIVNGIWNPFIIGFGLFDFLLSIIQSGLPANIQLR